LEPLSRDENITDIYITAPPEKKPITITHEKWGTCETGINLTTPTLIGLGEILSSRQNRSFDQTEPQLDAEIPELGLRLFMSRDPAIWSSSVMAAIRKRRDRPWTQPLFLDKGSLTPLASSVISNFIRLGGSAFVIGDIGTAKTSMIETLVPEIGSDQRVICYQDTEELHIDDLLENGYTTENVRVTDPDDLQKQVNAFLRGGSAYWLITEVRETEAVKAALGAAARRGSQPVVSSFHVRTKREMYDLVCNFMGLHEAAYKYVDLIISTAKFDTPEGTIRRVTEVSEVLKDWKGSPEYAELFKDNREEDQLEVAKIFKGPKKWVKKINSFDLSDVDILKAAKKVGFRSPKSGGSTYIPRVCDRLAIDEDEFLMKILVEARMKSDLLRLARERDDKSYLELPFVSKAYDYFFASANRNAPDYEKQLKEWSEWLEEET
ncbi:MAG: type II/IV secretion system ATPase subunit, partial [Hadesarchaea archaeon]|nr:type II/IV secretion system ATPase subunit [Hadesarchaea archaeon]